jgi:hypothetical protein
MGITIDDQEKILKKVKQERLDEFVTSDLANIDATRLARGIMKQEGYNNKLLPEVNFYNDLVACYKLAEVLIAQHCARED